MTDPPSAEKATRPSRQPWQRFTLLDALLLQAGFAVGFSLIGSAPGEILGRLDLTWRIGVGAICGAILGGPIILSVQWLFRGRRELPGRGEWLWLCLFLWPALGFLTIYAGSRDLVRSLSDTIVIVIALPALLLPVAAGHRFVRPQRVRRPVPCAWTDAVGTWLVVGLGIVDLFLLVDVLFLGGRLPI